MNTFLVLALILFAHIIFWYAVSIVKKRMDVADIAWGLGFPLMAWSAFALSGSSLRGLIVNILISLWGGRLALHIYLRNRNKSEDARYLEWRNSWKNFYIRSFLQVFFLQGALLYIIVLPAILININPDNTFTIATLFGVCIWSIGYFFETVGDKQLADFIKNPENKGKIMMSGLWKYSRHPNYFGEVVMWWGIFVAGLGLPYWAYTIVGPATISYLILFVSGVPLLEKHYIGNADYEAYKNKTSVFIPMPPRKL